VKAIPFPSIYVLTPPIVWRAFAWLMHFVDMLGRVKKAGLGLSLSVDRFSNSIFILNNGNQSYKFIKHVKYKYYRK